MEITEVRIKLMEDQQERLQAFCSITFDGCFVIRDLKIIEGAKGSFVAMPSRKLTDRCPTCHTKNHLRSLFCNQCGSKLPMERAVKADDGRAKLYADIAHPINSRCREHIQARVLHAYEDELVRAKLPGYVCTYDDYGEEGFEDISDYVNVSAIPPNLVREAVGAADSMHRIDAHAPASISAGPHHNSQPSWKREDFAGQRLTSELGEESFGNGIL
ncbi:MAG: SpoVG family protein [Planctomycetaceae bacterium]|nr:SpoVG family protein [Planctomycetaceae bacterium]